MMFCPPCVGMRGMGAYQSGPDVGSGEVAATPTTGSSNWGWLTDVIGSWSKTGQQILLNENVVRGVYTDAKTGQTYVQPAGNTSNIFSAVGGSVSGTASPGLGLVLIGGGALLLVFMLARKGH